MKSHSYKLFLETLHLKVPDRRKLVVQLMDLLCIEKEAVYRRLRQEVAFSFSEIELIAKNYNISLDYIIGGRHTDDMIFYLRDYDFINTPSSYKASTQQYIDEIAAVKDAPESEVGFAANSLPLTLLESRIYKNIHRFIVYKWLYKYGKCEKIPLFSDLVLPEHVSYFNDLYMQALMHVKYTYYIFPEDIVGPLLKDISYFVLVGYITQEEEEEMKKELFEWLNYLERLAMTGKFPTGNRIDFFVTPLSIETGYSYLDSTNYKVAAFKLFNLNNLASANSNSIPHVEAWLRALKKSSIEISVSGELQRRKFFEDQRQLLELKN